MFDWFAEAPMAAPAKESIPLFTYVKGQIGLELQKIVAYYHNRPTFVFSQHILVRLLLNLNVSFDRDNYDYVATVGDVGLSLANHFGLTTATNQGRVHSPGWFYGKGCDEIIMVHDTDFDIELGASQWRKLQPVRVLRHPFSDMSLQRCTNEYRTTESRGIVVIAINLPMLALQYKMWAAEQSLRLGARDTTAHFVSMFVITNMLYSHTDVCLFNRICNHYFKDDSGEFIRAHAVYNVDYTGMVDTTIGQLLRVLTRRSLTWPELMENVEPLCSDTLREALQLPDIIPTRQLKWTLWVARLPLLHFLVQFTWNNKNTRNQFYMRRLKTELRAIRADRILDQVLPQSVLIDIDKVIMSDIDPYL